MKMEGVRQGVDAGDPGWLFLPVTASRKDIFTFLFLVIKKDEKNDPLPEHFSGSKKEQSKNPRMAGFCAALPKQCFRHAMAQ